MIEFEFTGTEEALEYIEDIAREMVLLFPITMDEAVGRINRFWHGQTFVSDLAVGTLMHEEPDVWAKRIYYGPNVDWWLGEDGLEPLPYP